MINIVVLFGGQSSEHDVSRVSAVTVIKNIDKEKYNVLTVGITKKGDWLLFDGDLELITNGKWEEQGKRAIISPEATKKSLIVFDKGTVKDIKIDVVFPALHGLYGEDGTIQGLLELANIPYVGCGVLASSVSMDKLYTKIIVDTLNIKQAKYLGVFKSELKDMEQIVGKVEDKFEYPVFIKPSNAGSSVGITKASTKNELIKGLNEAAKQDDKILIEETIIGREVECAILGNREAEASGVGEIVAEAEFYDYDAKYNSASSKTIINADLDQNISDEIRKSAVEIFKAVDGEGLSRVDFFVRRDTNEVIFNEINTLPGFTPISMYPMLWNEKGIEKKELVDKLISLALERGCK